MSERYLKNILKTLIVADLHFRENWFEWLINCAPAYDAVLIAGDLLDLFRIDPERPRQARIVLYYLRRLARATRVVLCSGNHDEVGPLNVRGGVPVYSWLTEAEDFPGLVTDGRTWVTEELILTSIPYCASDAEKALLFGRGRIVKEDRPGRKWIVLHHVPPALGDSFSVEEVATLKLLYNYQPDYFISGHIHGLPRALGKWRIDIGSSTVILPGQTLGAPVPDHMIFDFASGEGSWIVA
jgi:Icc-related predicted phosphoesterase